MAKKNVYGQLGKCLFLASLQLETKLGCFCVLQDYEQNLLLFSTDNVIYEIVASKLLVVVKSRAFAEYCMHAQPDLNYSGINCSLYCNRGSLTATQLACAKIGLKKMNPSAIFKFIYQIQKIN